MSDIRSSDEFLQGAGSVVIDRLQLVTCIGEVLDLKGFSPSIVLYEDLYTPFLKGSLTIIDAANLFNNLPIVGEETIRVRFHSQSYGDDDPFNYIDREFSVISIRDMQRTNDYTVRYILDFVSTEAFRNLQVKVSRAWERKRYSEVVTSLMTGNFDLDSKVKGLGFPDTEYEGVEKKKSKFLTNEYVEDHLMKDDENNTVELFVEKTKYIEPFISTPFETPLNFIRLFSKKAIRDCPGFQETVPVTNFLFFENKRGFQYTSIDSLIEAKQNAGKFVYGSNTKNKRTNSRYVNLSSVDRIEIPVTFDVKTAIQNGALASRLFSYDMRTGANREVYFDILEDYQDRFTMNKTEDVDDNNNFPPFYLDENNRNERTERYDSKHIFQTLNYGATDHITGNFSHRRNTDFLDIEQILQSKISHAGLLDIHKIMIEVPGDSRHKVGDMVEFELREMNVETEREQLSKYFSGWYLITAIKHSLIMGEYKMQIELVRDSVAQKIGKVSDQ